LFGLGLFHGLPVKTQEEGTVSSESPLVNDNTHLEVAEDEGPELSTEVENSSAARAHKIGIVPRSPSAKLLLSVHSAGGL
jgi:hypothetical protein